MSNGISKRIRATRKERGLSVRGLAEKVGVTRTTVHRYESGTVKPSIDTLATLSDALGVSMRWLVTGDDDAVAA